MAQLLSGLVTIVFILCVVLAEDQMPVSLSISPDSSGENLRVECRSYLNNTVKVFQLCLWNWSPEAIWTQVAYAESDSSAYQVRLVVDKRNSSWIREASVDGSRSQQNLALTFQWECLTSYRFYCELSYVWPGIEGKVSRENPIQEVAKPC